MALAEASRYNTSHREKRHKTTAMVKWERQVCGVPSLGPEVPFGTEFVDLVAVLECRRQDGALTQVEVVVLQMGGWIG